MKTFIENDCKIEINGKVFSSGGAWLCERADNKKLCGLLYAFEKDSEVGSWDGSIRYKAMYGREYYSNFGDKRQTVYFSIDNKNFIGTYYKQNSDIVRVKQIK